MGRYGNGGAAAAHDHGRGTATESSCGNGHSGDTHDGVGTTSAFLHRGRPHDRGGYPR
jgi:hypothetical protein